MQEMATNNSLVTYSVIGQSYEGRDIGQVEVRTGSPGVKQIIFLECGVHAREWITESTCIWIFDQVRKHRADILEYFINVVLIGTVTKLQLASGYGVDPEITALVDKYDWIIVPTSNPDGYEYSWTSVWKSWVLRRSNM